LFIQIFYATLEASSNVFRVLVFFVYCIHFYFFSNSFANTCFKQTEEVDAVLKVHCSLIFESRDRFSDSGQEVGMKSGQVSSSLICIGVHPSVDILRLISCTR
jgi:hypothetical protein